MKALKVLFISIFAIVISCKEKKPENKQVKKKITVTVKHYICVNKCENSGSNIASNCPTCNTPYIHNAAFHNDEFLKNGPLNVPKSNLGTPTNASISPTQNALGVYHYTCPNGCNGGSGTAAKCKSCGTDLAHNQVYHN
ncbi:MAG: hypothetical protein QM495_12275 [Lutibacter sp.]|uniref:hypothetical protein n=1 Tax=Lutibacter sp. TaxID=1925666 RepID=UPI00385DFA69